MLGADAANRDVRLEIIFTENGGTAEAAEHGDLADVSQSVGKAALENGFFRGVQRFGGSEVVVKLFCGGEEALDFGVPGEGRGVVPGLFSLRDGQSPIKKITHVREDLRRGASLVADVKAGEVLRRAAQGFGGAVSDSGNGVAQKIASGVRGCVHAVIPFSRKTTE